jgi:hypothetical protein
VALRRRLKALRRRAANYAPLTQADKTKALFQVSVAFEAQGMAFAPSETAILDEVNANTLEGIVSVAQVCECVGGGGGGGLSHAPCVSRVCVGRLREAYAAHDAPPVAASAPPHTAVCVVSSTPSHLPLPGCPAGAVHARLCAPV